MFYKSIIQGRLSFGTQKSYDKVVKMYAYRAETYYKSDILLLQEDIFNSADLAMVIPRYVGNASDKNFKNTVSLIDYCSQFAVAGSVQAWMINEGKILNHANIFPNSDRTVVQNFNQGEKFFRQWGKNEEALEAFNKTIEGYQKHGQAYERRGWINIRFKNYSDALYDFNKAIALDDSIAFAYYGKGQIAMHEANLEEAIDCFEATIKRSVALQSVHWRARLRKAECLIELEQWEKAAFELRFFTNRKFAPDDSNNQRLPRALTMYGIALIGIEDYLKAIEVLTRALEIHDDESKNVDLSQTYFYRGLAKKKLNKRDAKADLLQASEMGYEAAQEFL
ncbi:MAG: tetratricopeptide repeat protein [Bacteroidota bacterium]